jgi:glycosyltransferase involved in cell wall biosynthesis
VSQVSIIVPNYNHSRYLHRRLDSILNQTFSDFECILLDDASTDNSVEILEQYVNRDSRFKLFINQVNSGSTFAQWNYGVSLSKGKFIWIAESDDIADNTFLQKIYDLLENNQKLALAYTQSILIDEFDKNLGFWKYQDKIFENSFQMNGVEFIYSYLLTSNYIPNASAVVFRKNDFYYVGKSVESLTNNGDWNLWLKLLTRGDIYFLATPLNYFRQHNSSVTAIAKTDPIYKNMFDKRLTRQRNDFDLFLSHKIDYRLNEIRKKNKLIISYEWGNFGLHLFSQKKYLISLYYIFKASFYPTLKSYYLKRIVFGNFYHRLFEK